MDNAIAIPGRTATIVMRDDLAEWPMADVAELRDRARRRELMIEADNTAYLSGRGREARVWHRIWLWCSMELDRRATAAAVKNGGQVLQQINDVAE